MQGFPGSFCYMLGVKVTDLVSLTLRSFSGSYNNFISFCLNQRIDTFVQKCRETGDARFAHKNRKKA